MKCQKEVELKSTVPASDNYNYGQKWSKPVRPQKPSDATQMGQTQWTPGTMPKGGFRSVFHFDGVAADSTKISNTDKPGRKVY